MDVTGILKYIGAEKVISDKFSVKEFVVTTNEGQYPQHVTFQINGKMLGLLDSNTIGDEIKVHFNLRGKEYTNPDGTTRYFNSLQAWKVDLVNKSRAEEFSSEPPPPVEDFGTPPPNAGNYTDLPF